MMDKKFISIILIAIFTISIVASSMIIPSNDRAKENSRAPENSQVINENWELERVDFIHYAKPDNTGKPNKPNKPKEESCYKLMGVKWKSLPVDYIINPSNPYSLSESFIVDSISLSAETWDLETSSELFNTPNIDYNALYGVQNYMNEIDFGDLGPGIIGVTSVWYTRRGKQIVEFDIRFNTDYLWGDAAINSNLMDLQNIATHELGHAIGMNDIYSTSCSSVTMYGYSNNGEIEKRSLEQPDIIGLQQMYN